MNPEEQLHLAMKAKMPILFANTYLENLKAMDVGFCLPGSIKTGAQVIPVIAIHIHPKGLDYFGLAKIPPKNMNHRLRYLDNADGDELVQVCLLLKNNRELALNLDPLSELTRRYLSQIIAAKLLGFIFFCKQRKVFISSFTSPDEEESLWIMRNIKRAKQLRGNNFERMILHSIQYDEKNDLFEKRNYTLRNAVADECYFNANADSVSMERINEYLF